MSNVNLPIGGRSFVVSCAEGEEDHIEMLGRMLDDRARKMGGAPNEARMLLVVALMLADELHEAHRQAAPPSNTVLPPNSSVEIGERSVERINQLAECLEKLGAALEQGAPNA
jgi:cell division protein ZapA